MRRTIVVTLGIFTILLSSAVAFAAAPPLENQDIMIFYSNDVRGEIEPCG